MSGETLCVVIPAKNEEETIGKVIKQTRENLEEYFEDVSFVISSSSTDQTDEIAREEGATVIRDGGRGLGEAMYRGLKKAVELETDYIMTIDSDLQFQPDEADRLVEARKQADLVLGSRFLEDGVDYRMSLTHRFGNYILTKMVNWATGLELTDGQTGYRLMRREVAEELRMIGRHTYVQETIIDAAHNGFEITEVPVTFAEREEGGSKVVSSITEYAFRTLPVIIHRSNVTAYLINGFSLLTLFASLVVFADSVISYDIFRIAASAVMMLLSLQALLFGMFIDGELP